MRQAEVKARGQGDANNGIVSQRGDKQRARTAELRKSKDSAIREEDLRTETDRTGVSRRCFVPEVTVGYQPRLQAISLGGPGVLSGSGSGQAAADDSRHRGSGDLVLRDALGACWARTRVSLEASHLREMQFHVHPPGNEEAKAQSSIT